jgi:hypothetical protein
MPGRLIFSTTADGSSSSSERMRITSAGNVGIGVTSPAARLDVSTTTSYGGIKVNANDGGTISFYQPLSNASARNFRIAPNYEAWGSLDFQKSTDNASAPTTTVLSIGATGKLNLLGGSASGGGVGITFPATQSASSDANTLDDYEEGTWSPIIIGISSAGTVTYNQRNGIYTKIGNVVYVSLYVDWSAGTGTGTLAVNGLPFVSSGSNVTYNALSVSFYNNLTLTAGHIAGAYLESGAAQIRIRSIPVGGGSNPDASYDGSGAFCIAGCYTV